MHHTDTSMPCCININKRTKVKVYAVISSSQCTFPDCKRVCSFVYVDTFKISKL